MTLRSKFLATSTAAGLILATSCFAFAQIQTTTAVKTGYAPVNGLNLYYEIHGTGEPLILLHGGVVGITMFGPNLAALSEKRQVIAVELQGHGHTADIDRPLSFEAMADDIAALMKYLSLQQADIMGYSLGGGVALQIAIRHPQSVRKLVVVSAPFKRDGFYPEVLAAMAQMGPAAGGGMKQSPLSQLYPNVNWSVLFTKLGDLLRKDYDWSKEVAAIKAPPMLVFADADAVRPAHIVEFFGLLGGGRKDAGLDGSGRPVAELAILPGLTHYNISSSPALATAVIPFLDAPMPAPK
jgi:pimeloyl-ACP methyl ester carboxylesterase